ncbi:hypothetical protein NEP50_27720, partial [Escherichia coli]|nr:hypothetical protein [Escherichia coli]
QNFNICHKNLSLARISARKSILTEKTAASILFYPCTPVLLCDTGFFLKQTGSGRAGESTASCQDVSG